MNCCVYSDYSTCFFFKHLLFHLRWRVRILSCAQNNHMRSLLLFWCVSRKVIRLSGIFIITYYSLFYEYIVFWYIKATYPYFYYILLEAKEGIAYATWAITTNINKVNGARKCTQHHQLSSLPKRRSIHMKYASCLLLITEYQSQDFFIFYSSSTHSYVVCI